MKNKIILSLGAIVLCFAFSALGAQKTNSSTDTGHKTAGSRFHTWASKLSSKDKTFMMNAAKGGHMEVDMGKIAAQNAQNPDVKKFGNRMVTDHSKANSELMTLASEEGVKLPEPKAPGKWKSDKDYMDDMVKDHEKDLSEFQDEAKNGTDPDLKKFAEKTSKVIAKHLELAKNVQAKLK